MNAPRTGRDLNAAVRPFAADQPRRAWWLTLSTLSIVLGLLGATAVVPWIPVRAVLSVLAALCMVRFFSFYHDHMHGSLLPKSKIARFIFEIFGMMVLAPASIWTFSHNMHHANTGIAGGRYNGSFETLTTEMWASLSPGRRLRHRISRHPLTIGLGYFFVFMFGMCLFPFFTHPRKNIGTLAALVLHLAVSAAVWWTLGPLAYVFVVLIPMLVSSALGAYLFYVQHTFDEAIIEVGEDWTYEKAALTSSSYLDLSPLMHWFTGNIGYHHVHHLNARIPSYRLPEAMAAVPELQSPRRATLRPMDIVRSFRLKLWDEEQRRYVGYPRGEHASG